MKRWKKLLLHSPLIESICSLHDDLSLYFSFSNHARRRHWPSLVRDQEELHVICFRVHRVLHVRLLLPQRRLDPETWQTTDCHDYAAADAEEEGAEERH